MRKLKANAILATFIFGFSLLMLCSFGTDAAYVILSRYKLQKITEAIAIEYASNKAGSAFSSTESEDEKNKTCEDIITRYKKIYNVMGSGVINFDIESMEYKADRTLNEVAVKVTTISKVLPAFLRFLGVREIIIHSVACASNQRIRIEQKLEGDEHFGTGDFGFNDGYYGNANSNQTYTEFKSPFVEGDKSTDVVTAKNTGRGDFAIRFGYSKRAWWWPSSDADLGEGGGFFVLAGYDIKNKNGENEVRWVDIGNKTTNIKSLPRVCADPKDKWAEYETSTDYNTDAQCFYCIDAAQGGSIVFDLAKDTTDTDINGNPTTQTGGRTKRFTRLRVYKAGGTGEKKEDGTFNNPCDPDFTKEDTSSSDKYQKPFYKYFNREAVIELTLLSNVSLIKNSEYNAFSAKGGMDDDIAGSCSIKE